MYALCKLSERELLLDPPPPPPKWALRVKLRHYLTTFPGEECWESLSECCN